MLHIRLWHAGAKRMRELMRLGGAPQAALDMVQSVVDSCRTCRQWTRPGPKSMTTSRLSTFFNETIQWDALFIWDDILSHCLDEAIRLSRVQRIPDRSTDSIVSAITQSWLRHYGPPRYLIADGESGLDSHGSAVWADRHCIQLRTRPRGAHAQTVERHHELFRQLAHRLDEQLKAEGIAISRDDLYSEVEFVKNSLVSVGGVAPLQALLGRLPPMLSEFEPASETQLDDTDVDAATASRHVHRIRELAVQSMVDVTAHQRMRRAMNSRTRPAVELAALQPGDQVDFHRPAATKDDSGWRGPASLVEIADGAAVVKWQDRMLRVRGQDLRRSLAFPFLMSLHLVEWARESPVECLIRFAEQTVGKTARLGWIPRGSSWTPARDTFEYSEILLAGLYTAACHLHLVGCIALRLGSAVPILEGVPEVDSSFVWFWRRSKPAISYYFDLPGTTRVVFGLADVPYEETSFVQFMLASPTDVEAVRQIAPTIPMLGGPADPRVPHPMRVSPPSSTITSRSRTPRPVDADMPPAPPPPPAPGAAPAPMLPQVPTVPILPIPPTTPLFRQPSNAGVSSTSRSRSSFDVPAGVPPPAPPPPPPPNALIPATVWAPPRQAATRDEDTAMLDNTATAFERHSPASSRSRSTRGDPSPSAKAASSTLRAPAGEAGGTPAPADDPDGTAPGHLVPASAPIDLRDVQGEWVPPSVVSPAASTVQYPGSASVASTQPYPADTAALLDADDGPQKAKRAASSTGSARLSKRTRPTAPSGPSAAALAGPSGPSGPSAAALPGDADSAPSGPAAAAAAASSPLLPLHQDGDDYENDPDDDDGIELQDFKDLYAAAIRPGTIATVTDSAGTVELLDCATYHAVAREQFTGALPARASASLHDPPQLAFSGYARLVLDGVSPHVLQAALHEDAHVVLTFVGEQTTAVVEREHNVLSLAEARQHRDQCVQAMFDELERWRTLGTFRRMPSAQARNVLDSRWVLKWNQKDKEKKSVKARLTVRGFLDQQSNSLSTFSATASRWSQRLVVSITVQRSWKLFGLDVAQAFLKGLTFDQLNDLEKAKGGSTIRAVQFRVPPGAVAILQRLEGYHDFDPAREVLDLVRPGFGLKDAPRLWSMALQQALQDLDWHPTKIDPQLYLKHRSGSLVGVVSAHVDDLKGGAEEKVRLELIEHLTRRFGKLTEMYGSFEHCGVQHVQLENQGGYRLQQTHYVKQLRAIPEDEIQGWPDDKLVPPHVASSYISLTCAIAWVLLTVPAVAVYVSYLQRHLKEPRAVHVRAVNRVLRYLKAKEHYIVYRPLRGKVKLMAGSDSAFCARETDGLATRGCFIMLTATEGISTPGGHCHLLDWQSKKQTHVCRATFSAELFSALDAANLALLINAVLTEVLWGPTSAAALETAQTAGKMPIGLHLCFDAKSVLTSVDGTGPVKASEKHLTLHLLKLREWLQTRVLEAAWWIDTRDMISDGLTKGKIPREAIDTLVTTGSWTLRHPTTRLPPASSFSS